MSATWRSTASKRLLIAAKGSIGTAVMGFLGVRADTARFRSVFHEKRWRIRVQTSRCFVPAGALLAVSLATCLADKDCLLSETGAATGAARGAGCGAGFASTGAVCFIATRKGGPFKDMRRFLSMTPNETSTTS